MSFWAWRILERSSDLFGVAFDFEFFLYGTVVMKILLARTLVGMVRPSDC